MREFAKGVCVVLVIVGFVMGAIVWMDDRPGDAAWALRIVSPILFIVGCGWFLWMDFQRDRAPDLLHARYRSYFNRQGFCFQLQLEAIAGVCFLDIWFQNQFERPCVGQVALRPRAGFFGSGKVKPMRIDIHCDQGAYGVARLPLPVASDLQGRQIKLEIGAAAEYPTGRGRRLRVRDGTVLRTGLDFRNPLRRAALWTFFLGGHVLHFLLHLSERPASVVLLLPTNVADELPPDAALIVSTLWRLDDVQPRRLDGLAG